MNWHVIDTNSFTTLLGCVVTFFLLILQSLRYIWIHKLYRLNSIIHVVQCVCVLMDGIIVLLLKTTNYFSVYNFDMKNIPFKIEIGVFFWLIFTVSFFYQWNVIGTCGYIPVRLWPFCKIASYISTVILLISNILFYGRFVFIL